MCLVLFSTVMSDVNILSLHRVFQLSLTFWLVTCGMKEISCSFFSSVSQYTNIISHHHHIETWCWWWWTRRSIERHNKKNIFPFSLFHHKSFACSSGRSGKFFSIRMWGRVRKFILIDETTLMSKRAADEGSWNPREVFILPHQCRRGKSEFFCVSQNWQKLTFRSPQMEGLIP